MPTATATAAPFCFVELEVARARRLGPSMVRITFSGRGLANVTAGGRDQRCKLFLPHPHQSTPVLPLDAGDGWFAEWRAMAPEVRAIMRSYTVREQRRNPEEIDIDFALHGDNGPASRWAGRARPGDRAVALAPAGADNAGIDFRPPAGTEWALLAGDETALPAIEGILGWLPAGMPAKVWIEIPHGADRRRLPTSAAADITWLVRDRARPAPGPLLGALRDAALLPGSPYAWIAGEAATVRALRRHLVNERGFDRANVTFTGYWRSGATEEDLVAEAVAGATSRSGD